MKFWQLFWTLNLLVAGSAFAFITIVVSVKGINDLRRWFGNLRQQIREGNSASAPDEGSH
jgi:hypothetical protein